VLATSASAQLRGRKSGSGNKPLLQDGCEARRSAGVLSNADILFTLSVHPHQHRLLQEHASPATLCYSVGSTYAVLVAATCKQVGLGHWCKRQTGCLQGSCTKRGDRGDYRRELCGAWTYMALPGTAQTSRQGSGIIPGSKRLLRALALVHDDEVHTRHCSHDQPYAVNSDAIFGMPEDCVGMLVWSQHQAFSPSTAAQMGTSVPMCIHRFRLCAMHSWHSSASSAPTSCNYQRATRRAWRLVRLQCTAAPLSLSNWLPCLSSWSLNLLPCRHGKPAKALHGVFLPDSPRIAVCVNILTHAGCVRPPVLRGCPDCLVAHISLLATYHMTRPATCAGTGRCCCSTGAWRLARWLSS